MSRAGALALAVAAALAPAPVLAQASPGFAIERPSEDGWGPVALAIVSLGRGYPVPGKSYCAPPPDDLPQEEKDRWICLGASIADHKGRIVRLLAASPDFLPFEERHFQRIGAHAMRWMSGGTMIAVIEKTKDGYGWMPWTRPLSGKEACLDRALIERFAIKLPPAGRVGSDNSYCIAVSDVRR